MKALELLKELIINMSSLNEDGYKFGRIRTYKAIQELEALEIKLKKGQDNYNKLWNMYSELKKENKELKALLPTDIDTANVWTWKKKENK